MLCKEIDGHKYDTNSYECTTSSYVQSCEFPVQASSDCYDREHTSLEA